MIHKKESLDYVCYTATGNPLLLGCNTSSAMSLVINFATGQGPRGDYVLGGARLVETMSSEVRDSWIRRC